MSRILIADDEPNLLSVMSRTLKTLGHDVLEASDGEQAMNLLREHKVDLTIVDIFMPNVDGMEFTIRVRDRVPDAKIIAMSGGGTIDRTSVLEIARRFGAAQTLSKPFEMSELIAVVEEVLGPSQGGQADSE